MGKKAKKRKATSADDDTDDGTVDDGGGGAAKKAKVDDAAARAAAAAKDAKTAASDAGKLAAGSQGKASASGSGSSSSSSSSSAEPDGGGGGKKKKEILSNELRALAVGAPSLKSEPLRLLDLAWERLDDFSANLTNVSSKQRDAMKVVNPELAKSLSEQLNLGRKIAKEAPGAYRRLERRIRKAQEAKGTAPASSSSSSSSSQQKAPATGATNWLEEVRATIAFYERPMQDVQALFASPPPSKKWADFKGNAATPDLYHTGEQNDPIPFVWYKSADSYEDFDTAAETFKFPEGPELPLLGDQQLTAAEIKVGDALYNAGSKKENRGDTVPKVRKDLTEQGVKLKGLDIDHVLDLGFGGADSPANMWPLDADINRRPVLGWRSHYGLNYKIDDDGAAGPELRTAAINDLVGKWFEVKSFMAPGDAQAVPEEGREPMRKSGVATADEGKV
jgi:hypothetical protein